MLSSSDNIILRSTGDIIHLSLCDIFVVLQTEKSVLVGSTNAINIFWKHTDQVYIEEQ